ncbi:MAG: aminotransferase class III-fold pyridoxal phosphate-dependent enzyme [Patescibacteria group bacterium]
MDKLKQWPGPKAKKVIEDGKEFCATTTVESNFVPSSTKRAWRIYLYDIDGNRFMDFCAGVGIANSGYGNKSIEKAIRQHLKRTGRIQYMSHDFYNEEAVNFAKILTAEIKQAVSADCDYKVYLTNSGTEAIEAGLKLAFALRPTRRKMLAFQGAFHGRTLGSLPLMSNSDFRRDYPMAYEVVRLTFPRSGWPDYIQVFKEQLSKLEDSASSFNSFVVELIQGQGGLHTVDREAMRLLCDFCVRHQIFLHVDEVQSGYGRTGRLLSVQHYPGVAPDIISLAKGIANGYPMGATVFKEHLDWQELGRHAGSYGGNALGCAAAIATLDYLKEQRVIESTECLGRILRSKLQWLCEKYPGIVANVRGFGLMQAIDFVDKFGNANKALCEKVIEQGYLYGLILLGTGESAVRIMPPLVISEQELLDGLERLDCAISDAIKIASV